MRNQLKYWLLAAGFALAYGDIIAGEPGGGLHKEIKRTSEKEVRVKLESTFGSVYCGKGSTDKVLVFDLHSKLKKYLNVGIDYRLRSTTGYLTIDMNPGRHSIDTGDDEEEERSIGVHFDSEDKWMVRLTDALPVSIDAELGAGKGEFDMTGLNVKAFKLSTGASSTTVTFDEPNKGMIENFSIESGVSKFVGQKLNNANFKRMKFEGGVGSYYLNFDGELKREVEVRVDIGLGAITIVVPRNIGAKVIYDDNWLSSFSIDKDFDQEEKGTYVTGNYSSAEGKMNIYVDSGLGSVKIKRGN